MSNDFELTAYCGLYCGDCIPAKHSLFNAAEKLMKELDRVQFGKYAEFKSTRQEDFHKYEDFRSVLSAIVGLRCRGACVKGGGSPDCGIRICVCNKGLRGCWECSEFEHCEQLEKLTVAHGETPKHNLRLIKKFGLTDWVSRRGKHYLWD